MDINDREIIDDVLAGNADKFELLVRKTEKLVFGIAAGRIPREDVEETAHQIFIRAYSSLENYRGEGDFSHWISSIAVRTCCDYWRKRYRSREMPMSGLSEKHRNWITATLSDESSNEFIRGEEKKIAREILMAALEMVPPEDRAVLELVYLEERPVKEAAELMDWSVSNVKVRAHRARKKLRIAVEDIIENRGESYELR